MTPSVVIHHATRSFYCWRHYRHFKWSKLNSCFQRSCPAMLLPVNLAWKATALGLKVPVASSYRRNHYHAA